MVGCLGCLRDQRPAEPVTEKFFSDVRCTLCGGSRLLKDGKPEVCSFLGCKDPCHDVRAEEQRANEALLQYPKTPRDPEQMGRALDAITSRARKLRGSLSVQQLEDRLDEVYEIAHHAAAVPVDYVPPHRPEPAVPDDSPKELIDRAFEIVRKDAANLARLEMQAFGWRIDDKEAP